MGVCVCFWSGISRSAADALCAHKAVQCVSAERKLLMRLDGVCRHYLAMTKSALFLFAHGGKKRKRNQLRGGVQKKSISEHFSSEGALLLLKKKKRERGGGSCCCIRDVKVALRRSGGRRSAFIFKKCLGPEDDSFASDFF